MWDQTKTTFLEAVERASPRRWPGCSPACW